MADPHGAVGQGFNPESPIGLPDAVPRQDGARLGQRGVRGKAELKLQRASRKLERRIFDDLHDVVDAIQNRTPVNGRGAIVSG